MKNYPVNPADEAPDAEPEILTDEAMPDVSIEGLVEDQPHIDDTEDPVSGPVVSGLEETEVLSAREGMPEYEPMLDTSDPLQVDDQGIEEEVLEANIDLHQQDAHDDEHDMNIIDKATRLG